MTDVVMTPEGVGTTARIVAKFARGLMVEQVVREYTEFVPDARIVTRAHGTARFAGRTRELASLPVFTWLFEAADGGTKLTFVLEEDLTWWQRMLAPVSALAMSKDFHSMLAAIKSGVERHASPPA